MTKFASILAIALASVSTTGHAAPTKVAVAINDLDLTTAQGQNDLNHRVAAAARTICGHPDIRSSIDLAMNKACRETVLLGSRQSVEVAIARSFANRDRLAAR